MHRSVRLILATLVMAAVVHAINPYLRTPLTDYCFPLDTPFSDICFGTRCAHLFNNTNGRIYPTPSNVYPQDYPDFSCNVSLWYPYGPSFPQYSCLRPVCYCKKYYLGGTCYPTEFNSCENHRCHFNAETEIAGQQ